MADRNYLSTVQDDRLRREFPGAFDRTPDRLLPKLVVAVVLGIGLAIAGSVSDDVSPQARLERLETPATATPPLIFGERSHRDLAAR